MPLARILTRNPERTADLSNQLKQQGYSVEVARPDQANLAPADLEIEFEVCERADVLDRAADLATEIGADVAVAPGILQMPPKPAAEPIMYGSTAPQPGVPEIKESEPVLSRKIEAEPETAMLAESRPAMEHAQERDPEREFEAAFAPVIEMPTAAQASSEVVDAPVMEHEPLPPVAFLEESPAVEPIAAAPLAERHVVEHAAAPVVLPEPVRPADPMPYLAQLTPFSGGSTEAMQIKIKKTSGTQLQRFVRMSLRRQRFAGKKFCRMAQEWQRKLGPERWPLRLPPRLLFAIIFRNTGSERRCAPLNCGPSMPRDCLIWSSAVQKHINARQSLNGQGNRQQHG